jgi:hypothetical protein
MTPLVAGFWGVYFGSAGLMLVGSLLAYARTRHRVPLRAAEVAVVSALFAAAYLGGLPIGDRATEERVLAHVAAISFALLALLLCWGWRCWWSWSAGPCPLTTRWS